jgi:hypothetical protein
MNNCNDCENAGNNANGCYICYQMKSNFWMLDVLNKKFDCTFFSEIKIIADSNELLKYYNSKIK